MDREKTLQIGHEALKYILPSWEKEGMVLVTGGADGW